jgi:predicted acyl esterase
MALVAREPQTAKGDCRRDANPGYARLPKLEITSSNFPRFDRNTNSGGDIGRETEDDFVVAVNRIYHGSQYPSRLILPIIDR